MRGRMQDGELLGMQEMLSQLRRRNSVDTIPEHRMADIAEMNPYLVCTPRQRIYIKQAPVFGLMGEVVLGDRWFSVWAHCAFERIFGVPADRYLDSGPFSIGNSLDTGNVAFLNLA
jgi:hypothetical protein